VQLSIFYRTHPGTNLKSRPAWSSRVVSLRSLRHAQQGAGVPSKVTFVADGGLPREIEAMVDGDEVVTIRGGNAASSLRRCIDTAVRQARSDDEETIYWFAEDDYLYRPGAFASLAEASSIIQAADYFALHVADGTAWHQAHRSQPDLVVPPLEAGEVEVDGSRWHRVRGTTSTFGVRRSALLADARLLKLGSMAGAPFDGATWHSLQGATPYSWRHLLHDLEPGRSPRGLAKVVAKPVMRAVVNVATRRAGRIRVLVGPVQDQAMHLEEGVVPPDEGWEEYARELHGG
jgi:hypothetical protein